MCGLNVVFSKNVVEDSIINRMNSSMRHRGPDSQNTLVFSDCTLGHVRLSIIDLSTISNQPMISTCERYSVVFNGEIYNYQELKIGLDYEFKTNSDTEVLIALYKSFGKEMLAQINGMFSFVIYDKFLNELFIARDRFGIKPLYFFLDEYTLVLSSSIKSIVESGYSSRILNVNVLDEYLEYQTVVSGHTLIKDINVFPEASYGVVRFKGRKPDMIISKYWDLDDLINVNHGLSLVESENLVYESLKRSVEYNKIADVEIGVFLSGGIDSSILTGLFSSSSQSVNTFNLNFDSQKFSEAYYAKMISKLYNTNHFESVLNALEVARNLESDLRKYDSPSGDGYNTMIVSRFFAQTGLKVAISGLGADEIFGGYPTFSRLKTLNKFRNYYSLDLNVRKFISYLVCQLNFRGSEKLSELLTVKNFNLEKLYSILRKNTLDRSIFRSYSERTFDRYSIGISHQQFSNLHAEITKLEIKYFMSPLLLRDSDQMSMLSSIELRVPFLDHNLVESVISLNESIKFQRNKNLLVKSSKLNLPDYVFNRKKMGFSLPWFDWFGGELRPFLDETFGKLDRLNIFNSVWLFEQKDLYFKGKINSSRIISLCSLYYWIDENKVVVIPN